MAKLSVKQLTVEFNALIKAQKTFIEQSKELQTIRKSTTKDGAALKAKVEGTKQLTINTTKLTAVDREILKVTKEIERERIKLAKAEIKQQKAQRELIEASKLEVKSEDDLIKRTNALVKLRRMANKTTKEGRAEIKRYTAEIKKNTKELKRGDAAIGRMNRGVGNYTKSIIKATLRTAAMYIGLRQLVRVVGTAFKSFIVWEKAQSKLASILGTTSKNIKLLTRDSLKYGAATKFTASEVTGLQTELAKLGFTRKEIIDSTKSILAFAAATGSELAESAVLGGASLRSFNIDASESGRVMDVLALATSTSALDMAKLSTAIPIVGATAANAGVSLERTIAVLGKLTDRGIDASTAATSLRNIFLELSKQGLTWDEAMKKIQLSTDKNKTALELFGKRGATAASIISGLTDEINDLDVALTNAQGTAQEMADEQLDNLAGDITKAASAWDVFTTSLIKGDGALSTALRKTIQLFTAGVNYFTNLNNEFANKTDEQLKELLQAEEWHLSNLQDARARFEAEDDSRAIRKQITKNKNLSAQSDRIIISLKNEQEKRIELIKEEAQAEIDAAKKAAADALAVKEAQAERSKEIKDKEEKEAIKIHKALLKRLQEEKDIREAMEGRSAEIKKEARSKDEQDEDDRVAAEIAAAERAAQIELDIEEATGRAKIDIAQSGIDFINVLSENQLITLEEQHKKGLISDKKFEKEKAKIQRKQALLMKANAIFEIGINTAIAVMKVTGQTGVGAFLAAPLVTAAGALQAAIVLARKIPEFAKGVIGYKGEGTSTSDSNVVKISHGESVIKAKSTSKHTGLLTAVNADLSDADIFNAMLTDMNQPLSPTIIKDDRLLMEMQVNNSLSRKLIELEENRPSYIPTSRGLQIVHKNKTYTIKGG